MHRDQRKPGERENKLGLSRGNAPFSRQRAPRVENDLANGSLPCRRFCRSACDPHARYTCATAEGSRRDGLCSRSVSRASPFKILRSLVYSIHILPALTVDAILKPARIPHGCCILSDSRANFWLCQRGGPCACCRELEIGRDKN